MTETHLSLPPPPADLLGGTSLFLDFDGTLVELASQPDAVRVDARLHRLMSALLDRLQGRLAVVSGRPAAQVRALFGEPGFTVAGSHGLEFHYPDGRRVLAPRPAALAPALDAMHALAAQCPGVFVEDKPLGAALHFRQAPEAGLRCVALAEEIAARERLHLQTGKMMIELRAPGGDKGSAIRALMAEPGLAGTRPIFLGDDDTDEPGFAAAAALGGAGILIGDTRPSAARYRLSGVTAALDWLETACWRLP